MIFGIEKYFFIKIFCKNWVFPNFGLFFFCTARARKCCRGIPPSVFLGLNQDFLKKLTSLPFGNIQIGVESEWTSHLRQNSCNSIIKFALRTRVWGVLASLSSRFQISFHVGLHLLHLWFDTMSCHVWMAVLYVLQGVQLFT